MNTKTRTAPENPRFRFAHFKITQYTQQQLEACVRLAVKIDAEDGFANLMIIDNDLYIHPPNDDADEIESAQTAMTHEKSRIELFASRRNTSPIDARQWKILLGLPNKDTSNVSVEPIKNPDYAAYVKNCIAKEIVVLDRSFGIPMHIGCEKRYLKCLQKQATEMGALSEKVHTWSRYQLEGFVHGKTEQLQKTKRGMHRNIDSIVRESKANEKPVEDKVMFEEDSI